MNYRHIIVRKIAHIHNIDKKWQPRKIKQAEMANLHALQSQKSQCTYNGTQLHTHTIDSLTF